MAESALILVGVYLLLALGLRSAVMRVRTGSTGFKGISGTPGSTEWCGGVMLIVAFLLSALAPLLDLAGVLDPIGALDGDFGHQAGAGLFFGGLATTLVAQYAMGDSWRIGVDPGERTRLVTEGPYQAVRNPIYSGMIPASLGIALLVPNVVAVVAVVMLVTALEIQTRLVEEPYLLEVHGRTYRDYAGRVGRFFPLVGRLR